MLGQKYKPHLYSLVMPVSGKKGFAFDLNPARGAREVRVVMTWASEASMNQPIVFEWITMCCMYHFCVPSSNEYIGHYWQLVLNFFHVDIFTF